MAAENVKAEAAKEQAPVVEKQTNCPVCNKPIKKLKRYYRNGKFYCNKRCWQKSLKSESKEEQK